MRRNPLARGGFILYLLLLHLWTFVVIVFHAHNYEHVHGDFGGGKQLPHGPHALMQQFDPQQLRHQQQQVMNKIKPNAVEANLLTSKPVEDAKKASEDSKPKKELAEKAEKSG